MTLVKIIEENKEMEIDITVIRAEKYH